ncbi:hypothetical protein [Pseudobacteriovorax antillogorgiicola]|uniref:Uncharacterized protein n=1 Tax=Pseudobacteriovorax antillogorgiicola TaxID=1513793 RepID=A0A1Y6B8S2_9BACT|nr:hypothetical protein [Pseudobacteriovorax antillogorgiicola]TCS59221.1 hypothetical protein EDD56_101124 [Pseudobacteriovorax antillogorgiicola]SME90391.1 hypothetical protein SAMN06296036_101362 [Pseudobacteriovorax antillogorgiicola]
MKRLGIACGLAFFPIKLLGAESFILFTPSGSKIKSELVVKTNRTNDTKIPNYFHPENGRSLFKLLIEKELKSKEDMERQESDAKENASNVSN